MADTDDDFVPVGPSIGPIPAHAAKPVVRKKKKKIKKGRQTLSYENPLLSNTNIAFKSVEKNVRKKILPSVKEVDDGVKPKLDIDVRKNWEHESDTDDSSNNEEIDNKQKRYKSPDLTPPLSTSLFVASSSSNITEVVSQTREVTGCTSKPIRRSRINSTKQLAITKKNFVPPYKERGKIKVIN